MKLADLKVFNLPDTPGVYFFRGKKGKILYVGKATNLKDRVKSYFACPPKPWRRRDHFRMEQS